MKLLPHDLQQLEDQANELFQKHAATAAAFLFSKDRDPHTPGSEPWEKLVEWIEEQKLRRHPISWKRPTDPAGVFAVQGAPHADFVALAKHLGVIDDLDKLLGLSVQQFRLLDTGHASVPDGDLVHVAQRLGRGCTADMVKKTLRHLKCRARPSAHFLRRLGLLSEEFSRTTRDRRDALIGKHFPDPLERELVMGPTENGRFAWKRATVRIAPLAEGGTSAS